MDIGVPIGTPVFEAMTGEVIESSYNRNCQVLLTE
ncbi:MAG: M23 family metallopeptidase [Defluviitaleaceae bacterium]|nr:M23 family metallopeptidase [Defluviitaleaceae bacterium]